MRTDDKHTLVDFAHAGLQQGIFGGFRHDDFVRFAVDHELPAAFMDVLAFGVFPDGQAPLFEQVDAGIDVAGDIGHEVFARDAHQVVTHVIDIILHRVGAVFQANVLIDGGKTHGDSAGTIDRGLIDQGDLEPVLHGPMRGFHSGAAGGHSAAQDE